MSKSIIGVPFKITAPVIITFVTLLYAISAHAQTDINGPRKAAPGGTSMLSLHTTAFTPGGEIPKEYTCEGANTSPALTWDGAPQGTQSFALIADDPDAPSGTFTHWVIYGISAQAHELPKDAPKSGAREGRNDFGRVGYGGPCPPPGKPHRYFFKLYALDTKIALEPGASRQQLEAAMKGHTLAHAEVMGTFRH
jgi:Raf kinase inhibitor-like YbhB/YbcL family protein